MKNNRLDAMLRRDTSVQIGLEADKALYAPVEEDIAPLREEHADRLTQAKALADEVFEADGDDSAGVKKGTRGQLKDLAGRVGRALVAHADSKANTDENLEERVKAALLNLNSADGGTFAQAVATIQAEATPLAAQLVKREVTADNFKELSRLAIKFEKRLTTGRTADVKGKTARMLLGDLLRANSQTLKKIRKQLLPYKGTARAKALINFDGNAKLVVFNNGSGGVNGGGVASPPVQ